MDDRYRGEDCCGPVEGGARAAERGHKRKFVTPTRSSLVRALQALLFRLKSVC